MFVDKKAIEQYGLNEAVRLTLNAKETIVTDETEEKAPEAPAPKQPIDEMIELAQRVGVAADVLATKFENLDTDAFDVKTNPKAEMAIGELIFRLRNIEGSLATVSETLGDRHNA